MRRGGRCAVPEPQQIHSVSPPLERIGARRASRPGSSMFSASTSLARAAVSYSICHGGLLPQRNVAASQRPVDRRAGYRVGGVEVLAAPSGAGRQDRGGQPTGGAPGQPGGHGAALRFQVAGAAAPQLLQQAG
jgi:hypothetical protein